MSHQTVKDPASRERIVDLASRRLAVPESRILPYTDFTDTLTAIFNLTWQSDIRVHSAGVVAPQVAQAADRGRLDLDECLGASPFAADYDILAQAVQSDRDIIYLANPNRVTGAGFTKREIAAAAGLVPRGLIVVDEQYVSFNTVSALPLLKKHQNMVVLRGLASPRSVAASEAGCVVAPASIVTQLEQARCGRPLARSEAQRMAAALRPRPAFSEESRETHAEALRLTEQLTRLGVTCRLAGTDFVLIRVAHPGPVGNALATERILIENLTGYPQLDKYLRYPVQSPAANERLVTTFRAMPRELWHLPGADRAKVRLPRPAETKTAAAAR